MMKKLFLATTALVALAAGAANAADLPVAYKAPPPVRPACANFGGFYVGAQVGYARYDNSWSDRDAWAGAVDDDLVGDRRNAKGGIAGGVGGGYNWQSGCTVFGISADYNWASINASNVYTDGEGLPTDTLTVSSKLSSFGTLQARTGIVVDNVMLYVTGGLAYANFNRQFTLFDDGNGITEVFSEKRWRWGGVLGVGTEWAITNAWSLKSEFLYMAFERGDTSFVSLVHNPGVNQRFENQDYAWVTRIGLNYRFGGGRY